jgi:ABC-type amino acid transport system permease subunit
MPEPDLPTNRLPQAFRIVIPAIGNDFISMIDSSLVYVLGVQSSCGEASTLGRRELALES